MGIKKGQSGNPNGRPKGRPNKITAEMKDKIQLFIESNFDQIQSDFMMMEPKDRLIIFERLLKYVIPTKVENEVYQPIEKIPDIIINFNDEKINITD